ncbi:YbhB/YbcL family Raf kinase inhibitor-like protein [Pseudonocardia alni]|uniref:YbhB/YbcL family Raf kinase inhibitor-like protein n=1 Tax=Pseudonocardia alni TaxID=33907 RepID=UPI00280ACE00|nr:YbhB/YbcL family Raf kinase inhibitor-like protein [Pseudonocardia alni]
MNGNDHFAGLPAAPEFAVTSSSVTHGMHLPLAQMSAIFGIDGGRDASPQLSWSGAPERTKSYAVTVYDPDAPTGSGLWHWAVMGIPADITSLPEGAGDDEGSGLPAAAVQLRNDIGLARFLGGAPPAGHGRHRYVIVVHALDTDDLGLSPDTTPAVLGFTLSTHVLARAVLEPFAETPAG